MTSPTALVPANTASPAAIRRPDRGGGGGAGADARGSAPGRPPPGRGSTLSRNRSRPRAQPRQAASARSKSGPIRGDPAAQRARPRRRRRRPLRGRRRCTLRRTAMPASRHRRARRCRARRSTVPVAPWMPTQRGGAAWDGEQREVVGPVLERDIGGQDVGTQGQPDVLRLLRAPGAGRDRRRDGRPGRRRGSGRWGEQQRATPPPRLQPGDVGREQVAEPGDGVRAGDPDLAPGGPIEEGTRSSSSAASSLLGHLHPCRFSSPRCASGSSGIIGTMEVPTTLVVTNDFPPRVGGIQRTLEALVRALPGDRVGVFCPPRTAPPEYDAEAPFAVFRQPERSLFLTRNVGRRVRGRRARARRRGRRCSARRIRLALLGPALAEDGYPYIAAAHGFEYWLSIAPGTHAAMRRATSRASRVAVMCSAFIARTACGPRCPPACPSRCSTRVLTSNGSGRTSRPTRSGRRSASGTDRSSCASAGSSLARVRTS